MRDTLLIWLFFAVIAGAVWFGVQQTADRYKVCRSLGHGGVYCFFSATGEGK